MLDNLCEKMNGHPYVPQYIMADGHPSITSAINNHFLLRPDQKPIRLMCFFHVKENVRKRHFFKIVPKTYIDNEGNVKFIKTRFVVKIFDF